MDDLNIKYKTKTAAKKEIYLHLKDCNNNFVPALDQKVNIDYYSKKIVERGVTFEAWVDKTLIGLIAAYFNDTEKKIGYITNVSVITDFAGNGIASELLNRCIIYARQNTFKEIKLEVSNDNIIALQLYKKKGFIYNENSGGMVQMRLELNNLQNI